MLTFPPGSNSGNLQCTVITLMHDNDGEVTENLIVELRNNDSAVVVPAGGDIVIINIRDTPNPFGKDQRYIHYRVSFIHTCALMKRKLAC